MSSHKSMRSLLPVARYAAWTIFAGYLLLNFLAVQTHAEVPGPITGSGLNTQVSAPIPLANGGNQYNITGGTRGGQNLFHSFGEFGVPTNNIGNFLNDAALPTTNILGRVTGGNPSNIFGTIQTTGFGNANLFLMNPAGIVFGPSAQLNVGGAVNFTTADYLRFADHGGANAGIFYASTLQTSVLSSAPVVAFGFLTSAPGPIKVQGSSLSVSQGQSISLVGGDVLVQAGTPEGGTAQAATLSAPGGQIRVASVASPGEVLYPSFNFGPNVNGQSFGALGNITFSEGTTLNVSDEAAGSIVIRGGQLTIADATLSADTGNASGATPAVDINITGNLSISDTRAAPAITARTTGAGDAGEVRITSGSLEATSTVQDLFAVIDTHTSGEGKGGNVNITTGNLNVAGPDTTTFTFINSGMAGPGHGGDISIAAQNINLIWTTVSTGHFFALNDFFMKGLPIETITGSAGKLSMTAPNIRLQDSILETSAWAAFPAPQEGGDITITATNVNMINSQIGLAGTTRGGAVTINADSLVADFTFIETDSFVGPGQSGGITVNARAVEFTNGSSLISTTFGDGKAGDITVNGSDHITLVGVTGSNPLGIFRPSGIFSNSFGGFGNLGDAGNVVVTTPRLEMDQGRINTTTSTSGHGGNVVINAGSITMSGEFPTPDFTPEPIFGISDIHPSGIFTKTIGGGCAGACGDAGSISITANSLTMGNGSQIDSGTSSTGRGGDISIHATDSIAMSGTLTNGQPVGIFSRTIGTAPGSGDGGFIDLQAPQITLSNQAAISASTSGTGNAGTITARANSLSLTSGAQVTSNSEVGESGETPSGSAGTVTIQGLASPAQSVLIDGAGSGVFTTTAGTGPGGNIVIDGQSVVLQNQGTLSAATSGTAATATGGTITVNATNFQVSSQGLITSETTGPANAGSIAATVGTAVLSNGGQLRGNTSGAGAGGPVALLASGNVSLSGNGTGLTSTASGSGTGGTITLQGSAITAADGATVSASSTGTGNAGSVTVQTSGNFVMNGGTLITSATQGEGGSITVNAGQQVQMNDNALISSSSTGPKNAGDIAVTAGDSIFLTASAIKASAVNASGGDIKITAPNTVALVDSVISSSVLFGSSTQGGNINIDPQLVSLQNSQILANAVDGNGGNITIIADLFLQDGTSVINASSQKGISGTVNIQSPLSNLSQVVNPLQRSTLQASTMLLERCAVRAQSGNLSSLTVRSRDVAPSAPGGMLSGPLLSLGPTPGASGASQAPVLESVVPKPAWLEVTGDMLRPMGSRGQDRLGGCGS